MNVTATVLVLGTVRAGVVAGAASATTIGCSIPETCSCVRSICRWASSGSSYEIAIGRTQINGTDSRVLATVGAFRIVAESDLERTFDHPASARDSVRHLEAEGLLSRSRSGPDGRVISLSNRGRDLLEASRWERDDRPRRPGQAFYAGIRKPRELGHDAQVYRAYLRAEERLRSAGGRVRRVVLDYELKRDYQRFLQERNRDRPDS